MNRRDFVRSLGAGIAASLLPFVEPIKEQIEESPMGVYEMLRQCERHYELVPESLDLKKWMDALYEVKKARGQQEFCETFFS